MRLSIIIPTLNRFKHIPNLINSLIPQIVKNNLEKETEVIIVDDHSGPKVKNKIYKFLNNKNQDFIKYYYLNKNRGPSHARNFGIKKSKGALLAFLDDDLIPGKNYVIQIMNEHKKHADVFVLNGSLNKLRDDVYSNFWFDNYALHFNKKHQQFYQMNALSSGHFSIKRSLLNKISPLFDESLPTREDFDLYLRLRKKGIKIYKSNNVVAYNNCRNSVIGLMKQHISYGKGEYYLKKKFHEDYLSDNYSRPTIHRNFAFLRYFIRTSLKFGTNLELCKEQPCIKNYLYLIDSLLFNNLFWHIKSRLKV